MNDLRSYITREPSLRGRFSCFSVNVEAGRERGNALLYVLLAVGLMAALTYAYVQDNHDSYASQSSVQIAESLFSQVNMIKGAIVQCALEYPMGGGYVNGNGLSNQIITAADNYNNPYPLAPSNPLITNATTNGCAGVGGAGCVAVAGNNNVRNLTCIGAPIAAAYMFQGANNQGRFLPPPTSGFSEWTYGNDSTGVYIQITSSGDAAGVNALSRLANQFSPGQYTYTTGGLTFTAWIIQG